METHF